MEEELITVCVRIPTTWNQDIKQYLQGVNKNAVPKMSKEAFLNRIIAREVAKIRKGKK